MLLKEMMDEKYKFEIPMSLYDINNTVNKNLILENMVSVIKQNGNVFLLGYPTNTITMLMLKVYHENIVRIMNNSDLSTNTLMFMTGMLELYGEEGTIYVTISESAREGADYNKKLEAFYSILVNSGCDVEFLDGESELTVDRSYKNGTTDFTETMLDKIKGIVFLDKKNRLNYSSIIKHYPITVKLINSTNYIKKREEEGVSFLPFKKINPDDSIQCIYGSLCVEAKLFGYMYNSLGKKWDDVKGYIAYWVGKSLPPNHILKKYNYVKGTPDDAKIQKMTDITIELLDKDTIEKLNESCKDSLGKNEETIFSENPECMDVFINAVQPIALTCPGCFLNWQSYINNIQTKWDNSVCSIVSGGSNMKRKTKKMRKKRNLKSLKRRYKK